MTYIFFALLSAAAAAAAACAAVRMYAVMPSGWLCEYGEEAGPAQESANRCRHRHAARIVIAVYLFLLLTNMHIRAADRQGSFCVIAGKLPESCDANAIISSIAYVLYFLLESVFLTAAALSDIDFCIIPDQMCAAAAASAVIYAAAAGSLKNAALGAAAGTALILVSAVSGRIISGREAFGTGDIKLMAACSAAVSAAERQDWLTAPVVFFSASVILSGIWFSLLLLFKKKKRTDALPMAPWIAVSALAVLAAGFGGS